MTTFVIRRILVSLPVIFGIFVAVFVITRLLPGDPCRALLGEKATEAACSAFNARYGYDQPIPIQFVRYLQQVLTGDLGESIRFGVPVTQLIVDRLPTTIELTVISLSIATFFGIKLGVRSATKRNSRTDVSTMIFANLGVSIPVFVLGLLLAYFFAVVLKGTPIALPPAGRYTAGVIPDEIAVAWGLGGLGGPLRVLLDFISNMAIPNAILTLRPDLLVDALSHLILPSFALATIPMAVIARVTRSSLLDVLGIDALLNGPAFSFVPAGDHNNVIAFLDSAHTSHPDFLQNFRRQGNNLHETFGTQFARHRPENTRADGLQLLVQQHRRVGIEPHQRAVRAAHTFGGAYHHRVIDFTLFNAATRRGILNADLDHIADAGVTPLGTTQHLDAHNAARAGIIGDVQVGLHLNHVTPRLF